MIEFSDDQEEAIASVLEWFKDRPGQQRLSLAGYAGTGKTVLIAEILRILSKDSKVHVCAPTGKAASVLRSKLVPATTFHKLIYSPETFCTRCLVATQAAKGSDKKTRCTRCDSPSIKVRWVRTPIIEADLVIVDESSMLNKYMVEDIESLARRVLYVGDHGQLPPIGPDPGIMRDPDIRLEKIHRQADGSGIMKLSHHMRRGYHPRGWGGQEYDDARVADITKLAARSLSRYDIVLCGYNKTRKNINTAIREFRGFSTPLPQEGERLICLQNDSDLGLYNGLLVTVLKERKSHELPRYDLIDDDGNEYIDIQIDPDQFHEEKKIEFAPKGIGLFDFGYCLTVHKAQGSEWDSVAVIEQIAPAWEPSRWRYTAATRAAKRIEYWIPRGRL